ncbi:hypothetical protein SLA2020_294690 [Shorea laevis]
MENSGQSQTVRDRRPDALGHLKVLPDELICAILDCLTPRDVARLACVSSVMYILCNEEPLWMSLCLRKVNGQLEYRGSWKKTTLFLENLPLDSCREPLRFDGFSSFFLYRRLYRCHTTLDGFNFDDGNVERKKDLSLEEFHHEYDGKKPVLLTGLAESWPARSTWTIDQLLLKYGDTAFTISQRSPGKISMKFKDYVSYMNAQHDEDPLYIFDHKFGEAAPSLLMDYTVPYLFQEDFFDILDRDSRPPFRWLIIGPERSGASWHVDPALTSAWNTLLCGRKRWALYPPGRVPLGVTVHVNDEDGDVNIETPSSLQWWLDFYPLLADEDKPIELTQLPGETIFVPSGWWHCVLNLETTVAVTQNFVNSKNFEFVCFDMAPGYCHKGVCRAGLLALDEGCLETIKKNARNEKDNLTYTDLTRKEKRVKVIKSRENQNNEGTAHGASKNHNFWEQEFSYDMNFLAMFLDREKDHYTYPWSSGNCVGPREMREWLSKLWIGKPGTRELIWKGACLALNADKWLECVSEICTFYHLPYPTDDEKLPAGTGSNPVCVMADHVVKFYVEEGLESSIYGLGTELEFYSALCKVDSPLKNHIPDVCASGILYLENGAYKIVPWDGKEVPDAIRRCNLVPAKYIEDGFPFGVWGRKLFEYRKSGSSSTVSNSPVESPKIWPYIITKRCKGKIFAQTRDALSWEETLNLASFLGEQLQNLHSLPYPPFFPSAFLDTKQKIDTSFTNGIEDVSDKAAIPFEWQIFIRTLRQKKKDAASRLVKLGDPSLKTLIEKVDEYLPDDFVKLLCIFEDENSMKRVGKPCSWLHSDIMDDNIYMEPCGIRSCSNGNLDAALMENVVMDACDDGGEGKSWRPSYLLDFTDLSIGDPINDLIPIHLDVFRGNSRLLKQFFQSYKLPLVRGIAKHKSWGNGDKFGRLSYHAMCYCLLHDVNVDILSTIFGIWKELKTAKSWEEIEQTVWGELNDYQGFA